MDIAIAQTIIGAAIGATVTLIAIFITQHLSKKQILEQNYDDKLEEIQNLYIEVKTHLEAEIYDWWITMEHGSGEINYKNYVYPIDKLLILTQRYEPSLTEDIQEILEIIQILKGNNDPDDWIPLEEYYHLYILKIDFSKTKESLANKFKAINQKYYQKRSQKKLPSSKKIIARSDSNNQNPLPVISEHADYDW